MNLRKPCRHLWNEWIRPLAIPVLLILAGKSALADINPVPSGSMQPTVLEGDVVFVNKLAYGLKVPFTTWHLARWAEPQRGDVVVCFSPADGTRLLKRVVAVPGDTIELRNDTLILNGRQLSYAALDRELSGVRHLEARERDAAVFAREALPGHPHAVMAQPRVPARRTFAPLTVPEGAYFMLGDNRDNSKDSRFFGFVPRAEIAGEAKGVFVSFDLERWGQPRLDRFCMALE